LDHRSAGRGVRTGASGGGSTAFGISTILTEVVGVLCSGEFCERSVRCAYLRKWLQSQDAVDCDKDGHWRMVRRRDLLVHRRSVGQVAATG
jgi:hypothetical protein